MNIIVATTSGHITTRPDTTWERDNENLYLPEFITRISLSPVIYSRICKSGRSVTEKFATRYFDDTGFGILLYPEDSCDGTPEGYAQSLCLDHTTFLTLPALGDAPFSGGEFNISVDGKSVFSAGSFEKASVAEAVCKATRYIYVRTGDILAMEIGERIRLDATGAPIHVLGRFQEMTTVDFKIIF